MKIDNTKLEQANQYDNNEASNILLNFLKISNFITNFLFSSNEEKNTNKNITPKPNPSNNAVAMLIGDFKMTQSEEPTCPENLESLVYECEELFRNHKFVEAEKKTKMYANKFMFLNPQAKIVSSSDFLFKKIWKILLESCALEKDKILTINLLQDDFLYNIAQIEMRIEADIKNNKLLELGISPQDFVLDLKCLGAETHHHGKIPIAITFSNGIKIVYKPRSLMPEYILCGNKDSVFKKAKLPTYEVICLEDEFGEYGYVEYLTNLEQENTMQTIEELNDYYYRMAKMEKIFRLLRCSDMHFLNFITSKKCLFPIDCEVFNNPIMGQISGVYGIDGVADTFDPSLGDLPDLKGSNQFWVNEHITKGKNVDFTHHARSKDLELIGVHMQSPEEIQLSDEEHSGIEQAKKELHSLRARFVIIETRAFQSFLNSKHPIRLDNDGFGFSDWIKKNLPVNFKFFEDSEVEINAKAFDDLQHNDIPIFFYQEATGLIFYETIPIAKRVEII